MRSRTEHIKICIDSLLSRTVTHMRHKNPRAFHITSDNENYRWVVKFWLYGVVQGSDFVVKYLVQ